MLFRHKTFYKYPKQIFFYSIVPWLSQFQIPFQQYTAFLWTCNKNITKLGCHYSVGRCGFRWVTCEWAPFLKINFLRFPQRVLSTTVYRILIYWNTGYWISLAIDMLSFQMNTLYMRHIQKSSRYCRYPFLIKDQEFYCWNKKFSTMVKAVRYIKYVRYFRYISYEQNRTSQIINLLRHLSCRNIWVLISVPKSVGNQN